MADNPTFLSFYDKYANSDPENQDEKLSFYNKALNYQEDPTVPDTSGLQTVQTTQNTAPGSLYDRLAAAPNPEEPEVLSEIKKAAVTGVADLVGDVGALPSDLGLTEKPLWGRPEPFTGRPETMVGQIGAELAGFLVPYTGFAKGITWASKLAKGTDYVMGKRAQAAKIIGSSALSSFVTFSPNDKNISALMQEYPGLQNPISEFLATDSKDPAALNRLKAAVEDIGVGFAFEGILKGLQLGIKAVDAGITKMVPKADTTPVAPEDMITALSDLKTAEAGTLVGDAKHFVDSAVQNVFDKFNRVKHIETLARKVFPEKYADDIVTPGAYEDGRLLAAVGDDIRSAIIDGPFTISKDGGSRIKTLDYGLQNIVDEVQVAGPKALDDFKSYLKYTRANHMERQGIRSGIKRDEMLTELTRIEANPHYAKIVEQTERFKVYNDKMLDFMIDMGVLTKETKDKLLKISPIHVPFYRQVPQKPIFWQRQKGRLGLSKNPVTKNRKDFNAMTEKQYNEWLDVAPPIDDITSNMIRGYSAMIEYGLKNRFKGRLYDTIDDLGDLGKHFATKLEGKDKDVAITLLSKDQLKALFKKEGLGDPSALDEIDEEYFKIYSRKIPQNKDIDVVWRNGQAEYYRIHDDLLYDSLASMGPRVMSNFAKVAIPVAGKMKNFFTRMVTMNPEFAIGTNLIADTVQMSLLSRTNAKAGYHTLKGAAQNLVDEKGYKHYIESGAGMGSHIHGESRADLGNYETYLREHGLNIKPTQYTIVGKETGLINKAGREALKAADNFLFRFEHGGRRQEFERLREMGYSDRKAAYQAREIGSDFGNRGTSHIVQNIAAMIPFFNASLQGLYRYGRAIDPTVIARAQYARRSGRSFESVGLTPLQVEDVERIYSRVAYRIVLPSVMLHGMYQYGLSDEIFGDTRVSDFYKSLPDTVKKLNWVMVLPGSDGDPHAWLIRKPFDFGALGTVATKVMDEWGNESEKKILAKYLWEGSTNLFRMGDGASWAPQIVRGPVEIAKNERFTGAPIVPPELANLTGQASIAQDSPTTSTTARSLARVALGADRMGIPMPDMTMSPLKMEHLLNSYFGTIGYLVREYALDPFIQNTFDTGEPEPPERKTSDQFYIRRFLEESPLITTQQGIDLYDRAEKIKSMNEAYEIFRKGISEYSQEQFLEFTKDPDYEFYVSQYPQLTAATKKLANINSAIKTITQSDMSGEDKLANLNELYSVRNQITKQFDEVFVEEYKKHKESK